MNDIDGKLIFISDLEGCGNPIMGKPQSIASCSEEFFNRLDLFLSEKEYNKIVFLGDYFDKGDYYEKNIDRIIELYEKYNNLSSQNNRNLKKVHIILGNRDLNKLRLLFEYQNTKLPEEFNEIHQLKSFQNKIDKLIIESKRLMNRNESNNNVEMNAIEENVSSLGLLQEMYNKEVKNLYNNEKKKIKETLEKNETQKKNNINKKVETKFTNFITKLSINQIIEKKVKSIIQKLKKDDSLLLWGLWDNFYSQYFANLFENNVDTLNKRLQIIYSGSMGAIQSNYEQITEYINDIFLNKNSKNNSRNAIIKKRKDNFWKLFKYGLIADYDTDYNVLLSHAGGIGSFLFHTREYYDNIIEQFRDYNDNILNYFHNIEVARKALMNRPSGREIYDLNNSNKNNIKDLLNIVNSPLINFISSITRNNSNIKPSNDFFLLQALGLKPDNVGVDYFTSFVQSCDCILCKGPLYNNIVNKSGKSSYNRNEYTRFLDNLNTLNIKFVSFGHNPICTPVPLIYRRPENENIIFIANDVSNGYRPISIKSVDQIPLSYIVKNNDSFNVGVGLFSNISPIKLPEDLENFKQMINEWSLDSVPEFNTNSKHINYGNNELTFPSRTTPNPFLPAQMIKKNTKNILVNDTNEQKRQANDNEQKFNKISTSITGNQIDIYENKINARKEEMKKKVKTTLNGKVKNAKERSYKGKFSLKNIRGSLNILEKEVKSACGIKKNNKDSSCENTNYKKLLQNINNTRSKL
jgi:hypothetical protein